MKKEKDFSDKYLKENFLIQWLIKRFFNRIGQIISTVPERKALEVGCGSGFSTQYLRNFLKNVHFEASDIRADLVKEAQDRNPDVKVTQESIYDLKRDDSSFDLVLALEVLEHLENPKAALKELHRITSKFCLVSVPNEPLWRILNMCRFKYLKDFGNTPGHIQHWSKKQFVNFLSDYFRVIKVRTCLPWTIALVEKKQY